MIGTGAAFSPVVPVPIGNFTDPDERSVTTLGGNEPDLPDKDPSEPLDDGGLSLGNHVPVTREVPAEPYKGRNKERRIK